MRLRVGVTGHREMAEPEVVARLVDEVLDEVGASSLDVWSALAEGADRLVVERVLSRPGGRLVAVLPLEPDDYRADFVNGGSLDEFDRLLGVAAKVAVCGPDASGDRDSAYERAGHAIVAACDVMLALWDGEPSRGRGGTAEIVAEAERRGRRVIVIPVERPEVTA